MLSGIGLDAGATDSVLCTYPFRLVGLGFEAISLGCMTMRRTSGHRENQSLANAEGLFRIEEP
jgi:hypothetical protein